MEDIVTNATMEMLRDVDDNLLKCSAYIEDIICYVLNRVPPKYITSGRGVLHLELEQEENSQQLADIYSKIKEAIEIISTRRKDSEKIFMEDDFFYKDNVIHTKEYYDNFPYFTGRILKSDKTQLKDEVEVVLYKKVNGKYEKAEMISRNWQNPFIVDENTYGYYTFWVKPEKAKNQSKPCEEDFQFKLTFKSKNYDEIDKIIDVAIYTEKAKYLSVRRGYSIRIDDTFIDLYP